MYMQTYLHVTRKDWNNTEEASYNAVIVDLIDRNVVCLWTKREIGWSGVWWRRCTTGIGVSSYYLSRIKFEK